MSSIRFTLSRLQRPMLLLAIYGGILAVCLYLAYEVRFDFFVPREYQEERLRLVWQVLGLQLVCLLGFRQFGSMLTYFSLPDLRRLLWALTLASAGLLGTWLFWERRYAPPRGIILTDYVFSVAGLCGLRLGLRMFRERASGIKGKAVVRIAIIGAGDVGASLARDFINSPSRGFKPVAFFDDDRKKHGKEVHGIPVLGAPERIEKVQDSFQISKVVVAMPSASAKRIREVVLLMRQNDLPVETVPSLEELTAGSVKVSRIRPVEVEDLLGRKAVDLDSAGIRRLVEGKVVLVTGAGGSIGSELCRQVVALNPLRLLMVEQSEGNLFQIEQELNEGVGGSLALPLIGDILDQERMEYIFAHYRPDIVFHAAAHKHVAMMERQPAEALKNNAMGTRLLAALAGRSQAEAFIFISTDKAINPTSVMGATKRLAEIHLQSVRAKNGTRTKFMAVRFGNVLGSSGSVIPIFRRQIAQGGPVTVTHPDVTRYFMTIPEAVGLVMQSAVLGRGGEIFVLDMGQPVKISDLARQMIELSGLRVGEDIEIKFTGLRPGEKLFEELQHQSEQFKPTEHPRIMRFESADNYEGASEAGGRELEGKLHTMESNEIKLALKKLIPEYLPYLD